MLSDTDLETLIHKAISLYNLTHSPNAIAKLIFFSPILITVQFSGVFCTGCSTMEITEAFAYQAKTLSQGRIELKHNKTLETSPHAIQTSYIVKTK
ncbi:hypothetical protein E4G67_01965 [Candidatus Bathyarchaeota archaeon]|nr:MAG: hypothetical protein E4G67_01965 [Candidatus Bathyarchaeota archaeon]